MTEVQIDHRYVSHVGDGRVKAGKFHLYRDCSVIRNVGKDDVIEVNERESDLLGLSLCRQCRDRRTGGPALEALTDIVSQGTESIPVLEDEAAEQTAWDIYNGLKERGFYIASRRAK